MDPTDATLVADALAGDSEAFAGLVRRHQGYAYGSAVGMLADFDLARDVVQEAFLCAYRELGKLRQGDRFGPWLGGMGCNTPRRALRELGQLRRLAEELGRSAPPPLTGRDPHESAAQAEQKRIVREALTRLGAKNREAVSLHYVDGLSYADIATYLNVTETTVQGRLQRGRAQLRKELTMVAKAFKYENLGDDFAAEIQRLLEAGSVKQLTEIGAPAVDPLCESLNGSSKSISLTAARALAAIGDARALRPVLRLLYGEGNWRYGSVFEDGTVLAIPGVREELLKIIQPGPWRDRAIAMSALANLADDDEVYQAVREVFLTPGAHPSLVRAAMDALRKIKPEKAVDVLTEGLTHESQLVRAWAARMARDGEHLPAIDACRKAFNDSVGWYDRKCAGQLVLNHGPAGEAALKEIMAGGSPSERATAAMTLTTIGCEEAYDVLKADLLRKDQKVKWAKCVWHTLLRRFGKGIWEWLDISDKQLAEAPALAWLFAKAGRLSGDVGAKMLRDGAPAARAAAIRSLARTQGAKCIPALRQVLREGTGGKAARQAFRAMCKLGEAAEGAAVEMLTSPYWSERKAAVCLLKRWGKFTEDQAAQAAKDPHPAVRSAGR